MGDVAQILSGITSSSSSSTSTAGANLFRRGTTTTATTVTTPSTGKFGKKKVSREVSALLGGQNEELLPPIVRIVKSYPKIVKIERAG